MAGERWIFTKSQLVNTPSRKCGIDSDKELAYRQQAANLIQDMGQRLQVNQLCINTAIVYMHRFYMFHSFTRFHRNAVSPACLFLAAKVEEQLRKLEHVLKVAHICLHRDAPPLDTKSETYLEQAQELVVNENILLQSLGFDITVDHPHTHVVKTCQLVRASKDLAQTSYFLATNSLHLTTMCLQYKPTVVACVCIHLACKWSEYEIPVSHEGKDWFWYVDKTVTLDLLEELTQDFLNILDKCPSRLKRKILTWKSGNRGEDEGPPEKRHKGEASSSVLYDRVSHSSDKTDKKTESASKNKLETLIQQSVSKHSTNSPSNEPGSRPGTPPTSASSSAYKKLSSDPGSTLTKPYGSTPTSASHSHGALEAGTPTTDLQRKPQEASHPTMTVKDYKLYRESKERKEREKMASSQLQGQGNTSGMDRKSHSHAHGNSETHKRHQQHHGRGAVDVERKSNQPAHELKKHAPQVEDMVRKTPEETSLKLHIKRESSGSHEVRSTGSPLKLKIKSVHSKEHRSERSSKHHHDRSSADQKKGEITLKIKDLKQISGHSQPSERPSLHSDRHLKHRKSDSHNAEFRPSPSGTSQQSESSQLGTRQGPHSSRSSSGSSRGNHISGVDNAQESRSKSKHLNSVRGKGSDNAGNAMGSSHRHSQHSSGRLIQHTEFLPTAEKSSSGSIFSPPPSLLSFDMPFPQGATPSQNSNLSHTDFKDSSGYSGTHLQRTSSLSGDSFSAFMPETYNFTGETELAVQNLETNGSSMSSPVTKKNLDQLQFQLQQLIEQSKTHIAHQQRHSQPPLPPPPPQMFGMNYMDSQGYSVPPPPPPPPEAESQPPPPPPPPI